MKKTIGYRSTSKKSVSPSKVNTPSSKQPVTNQMYFCHYRNAMYMGPVKNFKKDGKGILIHDNGLSLISNYSNDLMHGHNVFYAQHCLLSAEYARGRLVEAVYRTDGFMAFMFFNSQEQLDGKCNLLDFTNKSITYAIFRKGILIEKSEQKEVTLLNRIFDLQQFEVLIGRTHDRAVKHEIERQNHIEGQKHGNRLLVGFEKGGIMNGLGFSVIFRGSHGGYNPDTHRNQDQFQLRVIERGYIQNGLLNGFGQKLFKNGNLYIGQFKNGIFQGRGLLRNTAKRNWVSGFFQKGNLADLFEYNNQGGEKRFDKIIENLHERKANWINFDITLPTIEIFDELVSKIMEDVPTVAIKSMEQRKQDVLRRIQENFLCEEQTGVPNLIKTAQQDLKLLEFQKQQQQIKGPSTVKHFVQSFIPQSATPPTKSSNENRQPASVSVSKFTPQRKAGQDIRKSKIFDKSVSTERKRMQDISVSRSRARTPEQKKKIFGQLSTTAHKYRLKQAKDVNSPENEIPLKEDKSKMRDEVVDASSFLNVSQQDDISSSSRDHSRAKKSHMKSKIFHQDVDNSEESAPRFVYTNVEGIPEVERRRRMGLDDPL